MSYLKNSLRLKITVFLLVTALIFWLIPSGLIFGEGEEGGDEGTIVEGGEVIPPVDTTAPVITLNGDNPATVEVGAEYLDAGAIAVDDVDGEVAITGVSSVDVNMAGSYTVIFNFSDAAGNAAAEVVRSVNVVEPTGGTLPEENPPEDTLSAVPLNTPVLSTDKADYAPEETVTITGTGFLPTTVYTVKVTRPDGSVVIGDGSFIPGSDTVLTNGSGNLTYLYILDGILGTYLVEAKDEAGNTVATTTFTDHPYHGSIRINKTVTGGLTGTFNFTISRSGETTQYASITINSGSTSGSTIVSGLDTGYSGGTTWTVTETSGPGFECTSPSDYNNNVSVRRNQTADTYFTNSPPTYSVTVNKSGLWEGWIWFSYVTDEAVFTLTGPAGPGSQVRTATLDNGWGGDPDHVTWSGLPAGSYTLNESYPIDNEKDYTANYTFPYTFTLGPDQTFNVVNTEGSGVTTGTIIVEKVVKNFSGVVVDDNTSFNVTVNSETKPFSQNSSASFTVPAGTSFGATETGNANYDIIGNTGPVTVAAGETKTITITNQQKEGHITIIKHGLQDAENAYNDYSMFRLYKGSEQIGATAELDNFTGGAGDPGRPDTFTWDGLDWGTYTIVEEYGASNYYTYTISYDPSDTVVIGAGNLNKTVNIYNNDPQIKTGEITINKIVTGTAKDSDFVFTVDDGVNTPYTVNISGSGGVSSPITVEAGKTYTITENDPGDYWDTSWGTTIPGATYTVDRGIIFFVDGDNIELIDGNSVTFENIRKSATVTIEKDVIGPTLAGIDIFNFNATGEGPFALADGDSQSFTIEAGLEYTVTETLPNLNWLSDIADDGNIEIISETANSITFKGTQFLDLLQDSIIKFTNTRKSGTVTVTKRIIDSLTDIDYEPTIGTFSFGIGHGPAGMSFSLTSPDYSETLDVWCGIEYTIFEESTDPELIIVTTPITFTAAEGDNGTKTFFNRTGSITVVKVDETDGALLEGAILGLFEADGITPATDAFGNPVENQTTNASGEAYFTKLALGDYVVKEISAPTGYSPVDPVAVSLDLEVSDFSFAMKDPRIPGKVTVIKTDPSGALLDGVGFTIYYKASGNPVMPERFTSGGLVTFDGLEWGSYTIAETTPPAGYDTSDPVDVIINASNAESGVTVSRIDTPIVGGGGLTVLGIASPGTVIEVLGISELPFTGLDPIVPISGISTIIAGGLMVALSTIRKRFGKK